MITTSPLNTSPLLSKPILLRPNLPLCLCPLNGNKLVIPIVKQTKEYEKPHLLYVVHEPGTVRHKARANRKGIERRNATSRWYIPQLSKALSHCDSISWRVWSGVAASALSLLPGWLAIISPLRVRDILRWEFPSVKILKRVTPKRNPHLVLLVLH